MHPAYYGENEKNKNLLLRIFYYFQIQTLFTAFFVLPTCAPFCMCSLEDVAFLFLRTCTASYDGNASSVICHQNTTRCDATCGESQAKTIGLVTFFFLSGAYIHTHESSKKHPLFFFYAKSGSTTHWLILCRRWPYFVCFLFVSVLYALHYRLKSVCVCVWVWFSLPYLLRENNKYNKRNYCIRRP